jgi:hypothetical protein
MAIKKRSRNLPSKKGAQAVKTLFPDKNSSSFRIGKFLMGSEFGFFMDFNLPELYIQSLVAIFGIFILCQIRALYPNLKPTDVDRLPSFRFYKKKLLSGSAGRIFAFALVMSNPDVQLALPEIDNMQEWVSSVLALYLGNEKKLQSVNEKNVIEYIYGEMSRIQGLINSTPSNNHALLGLNEDVSSWTPQDVISRIPFFASSSFSNELERVFDAIRLAVGVDLTSSDEHPEGIRVTITEPPLVGTHTVNGSTLIENYLFGDNLVRSGNPSSKSSFLNKEPSKVYKSELALSYLNVLENKKYAAAIYLKRNDVISKFNKIIEDGHLSNNPDRDGEQLLKEFRSSDKS